MTPIVPRSLLPDEFILKGYTGGMALYIAHWESMQMLFIFKCNEFVLRYEQYYSTILN